AQTMPGMGAPAAPMMEAPAMPMAMGPSPSAAAVPTLMLKTGGRSRLPLIVGAVAVAAGVAIGVWFVTGRGGKATEVEAPAVTAPVSNKVHRRDADEAEAADVRNADN